MGGFDATTGLWMSDFRRRSVIASLTVLVMLSLPAVSGAESPDVPSLAATTVVSGDRSLRFSVEAPTDVVVDLSFTAAGLPTALSVEGGAGFVGFLLAEPGRTDGVAVLAVRLPEPQRLPDGTDAPGFGWGQGADGAPCERCVVPAGVYDLHLLTDDTVTVRVDVEGLDEGGEQELRSSEGFPAGWQTHHDPIVGPSGDLPSAGGSAGMATYNWASWDRRGWLLDAMAVRVEAALTPVVVSDARFCRHLGDGSQCERDPQVADDIVHGTPRVSAATVPAWETLGASLDWTAVGNASYRLTHHMLWVPATGLRTATAEDDSRELSSLVRW